MKRITGIAVIAMLTIAGGGFAQTIDMPLNNAEMSSQAAISAGSPAEARALAAKAMDGISIDPAPAVRVNLAGPGGGGNTSARAHSAAPAPKAAKPYYPPPPYPGYQPFPGYQPHPGYPQQPGYQPYPGQQPFPGYQPYPQYPSHPLDLTPSEEKIALAGMAATVALYLAAVAMPVVLGVFAATAVWALWRSHANRT